MPGRTEGDSQQRGAFVVADCHAAGPSWGESLDGKGSARMHSHLEVFSRRILSSRPFLKPARKACVALWDPRWRHSRGGRPPRLPRSCSCAPWRRRAKSKGPRVRPVEFPFTRGFLWSEQDESVVRAAVPGQSGRDSSDFTTRSKTRTQL